MDKLTDCKLCGSNASYETKVNEELTSYFCFGCGYTTTTLMTENSEAVKDTIATSPELHKALMKVEDGLVWFPATITLPNEGMVFADGNSKDNWNWSAVKTVPITEEEKSRFPEGQEVKMDMHNIKKYDAARGFMDALEYIGFFNQVNR